MNDYKLIPLSKYGKNAGKYYAIIDTNRYDEYKEYNWCYDKGYAKRFVNKINGKRKFILMHREIMSAPDNIDIDHQNGNGLDNRMGNLRFASDSQNEMNKNSLRNKEVKYKGVFIHRKKGKEYFRAVISLNKKKMSLGYFKTETEAAYAYDAASVIYHGVFGKRNFT